MKRFLVLSFVCLVCLGVIACKKNPTGPSNPTTTTPTPKSVEVTSPNSTILVGQTEQMTATVTMTDNTTKPGTGVWGSDNMSVATVTQSGLVTGVGVGDATIFFDQTGNGRGTKKLRVIPKAVWTVSGQGDMVFDMPTYVSRVRIIGTYTGWGSNFIVWVGGDLLVNVILGTGWGTTRYDGTLLTTGGVVSITNSSGVSWSFTEVR